MNVRPPFLAMLLLALATVGCASKETREQKQREAAEEEARWRAQQERGGTMDDHQFVQSRDERHWQDFLLDYAHRLGKAKSELTKKEREEARELYEREYGPR